MRIALNIIVIVVVASLAACEAARGPAINIDAPIAVSAPVSSPINALNASGSQPGVELNICKASDSQPGVEVNICKASDSQPGVLIEVLKATASQPGMAVQLGPKDGPLVALTNPVTVNLPDMTRPLVTVAAIIAAAIILGMVMHVVASHVLAKRRGK